MSQQPIKLIVLVSTLPGRGEEQVAAFEALAPLVRAEEGCLQYDLHRVADDPDRFALIERWASAEALAAHDVAPHMVAAGAANKAFRAGPAEVVRLVDAPVGSPGA
ncbi:MULTISPECIES: putative quinol monooxygenase [Streptomyces]|uniref:Quinol monooxygenase YgiN n=1 Tax=Streptomyces nymphaeiformis TaxID=2663842 RepID=A0A7W7U0Z7_9ACTN|nr:putative quinol monooxygenase [Streptomyces nymphaeiformis]MBB4982691.1 quinol monooxygenase YgiN [Streptomyces nymphaeiformis]